MRAVLAGLCLALTLAGAAIAADGTQVQTAGHWRGLTEIDVEAAYRLLKENHPGAAAEAGDPQFVSALEQAHATARTRAAQVTTYEGYVATLGGFAGALGDGHIAAQARFQPTRLQWAGIIAARRDGQWIAASVDPRLAPAVTTGARIVSCDDQPIEARAHEAIGFRTDPTVDAMQVLQGAWVLFDDGNPFLKAPKSCLFETNGRQVAQVLNWTSVSRAKLIGELWKRPYGEAGFGVVKSGEGYWIGVGSLTPQLQPVIETAAAQAGAIRAAPFVVVDLRGDGGGDDNYARALAEAMYGGAQVANVLGPVDGGRCPSVYRASKGNIAAMAREAEDFEKAGDVTGADEYRSAVKAMRAAAGAGRALTGRPACPLKRAAAARPASLLMKNKVFVLTDAVCFSSCLQAVEFFRDLGAVHVGQTTGADTHFSEVRGEVLPSGLTTFTTLQAIMPDHPRRIGPYVPDVEYDGDIADTAALERWIAGLAAGKK
jgi:hypothetical protein